MNVWKPSSRAPTMRSATCSGVPIQNVASFSTLLIGVRLWAIRASHARRASTSVSRISGLQPAVSSICDMSRPTAAQCSSRTATFRRRNSVLPIAFHMSAYIATVRRVFFSPEPPIMIGMRGCSGRGNCRSSSNR